MEGFGAFLGEEWESLNRMISVEDSDDHFFRNNDEIPSIFWSTNGENVQGGVSSDQSLYYPSFTHDHILDTNLYNSVSQESSNSSGNNQDNNYGVNFVNNVTNDTFDQSMNLCENDNLPVPVFSDDMMKEILQLKTELYNEQLSSPEVEMQHKRKYETELPEANSSQGSKKRSRVSKQAPKNKKKAESTKNKKNSNIDNEEDNNNASACSSEDESKDSESLNSKGKARASRGSATDPQSLYARRRRERINERLRILQNLVPNGTKVDISTMLEEAVHYVKFLQLQIKLLSSDDMWMYAPIAHNGMDMGLYQNIISNLTPQI